jgi:hypothetical protein
MVGSAWISSLADRDASPSGAAVFLNRRLGVRGIKAGTRTARFSAPFAGPEFILTASSERGSVVDASYLTFLVNTTLSLRFGQCC